MSEGIGQNQAFWQLASIQVAASGLPFMQIGAQLSQDYGPGAALVSIIIGNLILWMLQLAIISMSYQEKSHSIENVKTYLGVPSATLGSIILLCAFLLWIPIQLKSGLELSSELLSSPRAPYIGARIAVALGICIALLTAGGIKWIKNICVICLPIMFVFIVYIVVRFWYLPSFHLTWAFSLQPILAVISTTLPGTVNLPTFFRHARSLLDGLLATSFVALGTAFWQTSGMFTSFLNSDSGFPGHFAAPDLVVILSLVLLSVVCVNIVNIYFGSAGLDFLFRRRWGAKEYIIIGLAGTLIFGFLQIRSWMFWLEDLFTSYLGSLGMMLLASYVIQTIVKHRPRRWGQYVASFCWLVGCAASTYQLILSNELSYQALLSGIVASLLTLLIIVFFEETIWCAMNLRSGAGSRGYSDIPY